MKHCPGITHPSLSLMPFTFPSACLRTVPVLPIPTATFIPHSHASLQCCSPKMKCTSWCTQIFICLCGCMYCTYSMNMCVSNCICKALEINNPSNPAQNRNSERNQAKKIDFISFLPVWEQLNIGCVLLGFLSLTGRILEEIPFTHCHIFPYL